MSLEISRPDFTFSSLHDPEDIVLQEHFEDFGQTSQLKPINFVRAFHCAVNGLGAGSLTHYRFEDGNVYWDQIREPKPLNGVTLVKRTEVGIDSYTPKAPFRNPDFELLAQYGMTAGSLVLGIAGIQRNMPRDSPNTIKALHEVSEQLSGQLEASLPPRPEN